MSGQLRVLFTCRRRGHIFASVVETANGPVAIITNTTYTDIGPRPGTIRKKGFPDAQQFAIRDDETWSTEVVCGCRAPARFLTSGICQVQLTEWAKHNRPNVRRIVLDSTA